MKKDFSWIIVSGNYASIFCGMFSMIQLLKVGFHQESLSYLIVLIMSAFCFSATFKKTYKRNKKKDY